jgi:Peptidase propeptide and YPEB domain
LVERESEKAKKYLLRRADYLGLRRSGKVRQLLARQKASALFLPPKTATNAMLARLCSLIVRRFVMSKFAAIAFAAMLWVVPFNFANADQPGPDWMPAEQVKAKAMQSGYTQVTKLKADDGQWEGEGIKNGARMEFKADPKTGAITSEKPDDDDD